MPVVKKRLVHLSPLHRVFLCGFVFFFHAKRANEGARGGVSVQILSIYQNPLGTVQESCHLHGLLVLPRSHPKAVKPAGPKPVQPEVSEAKRSAPPGKPPPETCSCALWMHLPRQPGNPGPSIVCGMDTTGIPRSIPVKLLAKGRSSLTVTMIHLY